MIGIRSAQTASECVYERYEVLMLNAGCWVGTGHLGKVGGGRRWAGQGSELRVVQA